MSLESSWKFQLCMDVVTKIFEHYGENREASCYPEPKRAIVVVISATGIIGNGGFGYFFSSHLPGDEDYAYTLNSFKAIGSIKALVAINKALQLFPNGHPPSDETERMAIYHKWPEDLLSAVDNEFFDSIDDIESRMVDYIFNNQLHKKWNVMPIM